MMSWPDRITFGGSTILPNPIPLNPIGTGSKLSFCGIILIRFVFSLISSAPCGKVVLNSFGASCKVKLSGSLYQL